MSNHNQTPSMFRSYADLARFLLMCAVVLAGLVLAGYALVAGGTP